MGYGDNGVNGETNSASQTARRWAAAPWIKWVKGLPGKTEVLQIAKLTGKNRREVACMCMELWEWADSNAGELGNARGVTPAFIDEHVGAPGFAAALQQVGWLLIDDDGAIFPNYERHNGNNAKNRAQTQKRVQTYRR